jgi:tRNA-dihydrouridine synthase
MKVFNPKGKVCLAPMAGFSDRVFRKICREMDAGFVYSEMVSADGILQKNSKTEDILHFEKEERPIGIQIFGSDPGKISDAAKVIADREKPDFIDINFGCPVK